MRRRMMMLFKGDEEDMPWTKLYDGSKTFDLGENGVAEFDLEETMKLKEFYIRIVIPKDTTHAGSCNHELSINGTIVGYYIMNYDCGSLDRLFAAHQVYEPFNFIVHGDYSQITDLAFMNPKIRTEPFYPNDNPTGKLRIGFPKGYTGTIEVKLYGR